MIREEGLVARLFAIDYRSLALFRVVIALLILVDLGIRVWDLGAMYTDSGMFSRAEVYRRLMSPWNWSFHFGGGSEGYALFLFALAAALALCLLLGFQTRLAAIGSWSMLLSLQHRVPAVLSGADILMRMLLFWAMFLPLHRKWSVDAWLAMRRGGASPVEGSHLSVASAAALLQMAMMYLFSAISKSNREWYEGEVIANAFTHSFYATPFAAYLLEFPHLLKIATWATLILEWVGPFLLFLPKWTERGRLFTVAALTTMHLGIALCLEVDFFSAVAVTGLLLFLPRAFWEYRWWPRIHGQSTVHGRIITRSTLVADGVAMLALLCVVGININGLPGHPLTAEPPVKPSLLRTAFGLGQRWHMFDEAPSRSGWYVARARLADHSEVDLLRGGLPIDWRKPAHPLDLYPTHRWRKLFREMAYDDSFGFQLYRVPVADYLCRRWNASAPSTRQVVEFEFIYCLDSTKPSNIPASPSDRERLVYIDFREPEYGPPANGRL